MCDYHEGEKRNLSKFLTQIASICVISLGLRPRLIALASTLIILDITKTSSNYCSLLLLLLLLNRKQHKAHELDMITRDIECPKHDYCIICSYDVTGFDQDLQQL